MVVKFSKEQEIIKYLNFQDFVTFIKNEISSSKSANYDYLIKSVIENFSMLISNDSLNLFSVIQDSNITSNSVFKIKLNDSENKQFILKIRRESSTLNFSDELNYLSKLQVRELIPKQIMNIQSGDLKISIEEFINLKHIRDDEAYNYYFMYKIINSLANFCSIETKIVTINEILDYHNFYFNFVLNKLLPNSLSKLMEIQGFFESSNNKDSLCYNYYLNNKNILIKINNFFLEIPNFVKIIISNFSFKNKIPLVFSHIDIHTWNFFIDPESENIKFIDFEDLSFCILGFDLANYIIESEYSFEEESYPYYKNNFNTFTDEFVENSMNSYVLKLNYITKENFPILSLHDIYRLFCLSIIKAVSEYVFMVDEKTIYLKQDIDFLSLMMDRISVFEKYYKLIN